MHLFFFNFQWHQLCNFKDVFVLPVSNLLNFSVLLALLNCWQNNRISERRCHSILYTLRDYLDVRELKQTTTKMATKTSLNKRFNEQDSSCARALYALLLSNYTSQSTNNAKNEYKYRAVFVLQRTG